MPITLPIIHYVPVLGIYYLEAGRGNSLRVPDIRGESELNRLGSLIMLSTMNQSVNLLCTLVIHFIIFFGGLD